MDENVYQTRDLYLAAFLLAKGHKILYVNRNDLRHVCFVFTDFEDRADLLKVFLYGEAAIEPQAFIAAIKNLKGLIYSND